MGNTGKNSINCKWGKSWVTYPWHSHSSSVITIVVLGPQEERYYFWKWFRASSCEFESNLNLLVTHGMSWGPPRSYVFLNTFNFFTFSSNSSNSSKCHQTVSVMLIGDDRRDSPSDKYSAWYERTVQEKVSWSLGAEKHNQQDIMYSIDSGFILHRHLPIACLLPFSAITDLLKICTDWNKLITKL